MGSGIDDGWKAEETYRLAIKNAKEMDTLSLADEEYKNLVDAHIAISVLIRQQLNKFVEIKVERERILKDNWVCDPAASIEELDQELERNIISWWEVDKLMR